MKHSFLLLLVLPVSLYSQNSIKTFVKGEVRELSVSPDGSVWICDDAGFVYKTSDMNSAETVVTLPTPKPDYFGEQHIHIDRISFFTKDNFFISGYLSDDLTGKEFKSPNQVYLTSNNGVAWEPVKFSSGGEWIYDCFALPDGRAWMGGSTGDLYATGDFGKTWQKCTAPFGSKDRLGCIAYSDKIAIVGATENKLKISTDNFKTFKKIETPLDQGKYPDPNKAKPEYTVHNSFSKTAIMGDYFIVDQNAHVFYSKTDAIDWTAFPKEISTFETDEQSHKVIGITADNKVLSFSETFSDPAEIFTVPEEEHIKDLKVMNGIVYLLTEKYAKPKEGDDVVGTIGKMQITRVGYKKVAAYKIYRITGTESKSLEMAVRKL